MSAMEIPIKKVLPGFDIFFRDNTVNISILETRPNVITMPVSYS